MKNYRKEKNFFSHITVVYNSKKKQQQKKFFLGKKKISFDNVKNPILKKKFYKNFNRLHNINLFFKNRNYFIEKICYKKTINSKESFYQYYEKKNNIINIISRSPDLESDIRFLKLFISIRRKPKYFTLKNKSGNEIRIYESKRKINKRIFLENEGVNLLSFFVSNITKVHSIFKKKKMPITQIFNVKLIKNNRIFFARFPSGAIIEFLNY